MYIIRANSRRCVPTVYLRCTYGAPTVYLNHTRLLQNVEYAHNMHTQCTPHTQCTKKRSTFREHLNRRSLFQFGKFACHMYIHKYNICLYT